VLRTQRQFERHQIVSATNKDAVQDTHPISHSNTSPPLQPAKALSRSSSSNNKNEKQGTLFGAIALIVGSTIGAGILALPSVTAPAGIGPTSAALIAGWAILTLEALSLAEVNITMRRMLTQTQASSSLSVDSPSYISSSSSSDEEDINNSNTAISKSANQLAAILLNSDADELPRDQLITLRQMAEFTLGGTIINKMVIIVLLGLAYSLLVAYLAKIAEVMDYFTGNSVPPAVCAAAFVALAGGLFTIGGNKAADKINQALASVLLLLFACILLAGSQAHQGTSSVSSLFVESSSNPGNWAALTSAFPIIFLSLVYHDLVGVICTYLRNDVKMVRSAIFLGSLIPLVMFLSWEAVSLSLLPPNIAVVADNGIGIGGKKNDVGAAVIRVVQASLTNNNSNQMVFASDGSSSNIQTIPPSAPNLTKIDPNAAPEVISSSSSSSPASTSSTPPPPPPTTTKQKPMVVDPLEILVARCGPQVGLLVKSFSFLAVMTSFLGTVISTKETLRSEVPGLLRQDGLLDGLLGTLSSSSSSSSSLCSSNEDDRGRSSSSSNSSATNGAITTNSTNSSSDLLPLALTLGPPLVFTTFNPDSFIGTLSAAGGYGMTFMYGILPPMMVWSLRRRLNSMKKEEEEGDMSGNGSKGSDSGGGGGEMILVPGGDVVLGVMLVTGAAVGLSRLMTDVHL
jgi:amino acid permease